jgi:hypothetical protein
VLLEESGTIWCLLSITINPTITVVVMPTDKWYTGQVLMGPFINFECALNNGFVRIKFDAFFFSKPCDYRSSKTISLYLGIAHVTVK